MRRPILDPARPARVVGWIPHPAQRQQPPAPRPHGAAAYPLQPLPQCSIPLPAVVPPRPPRRRRAVGAAGGRMHRSAWPWLLCAVGWACIVARYGRRGGRSYRLVETAPAPFHQPDEQADPAAESCPDPGPQTARAHHLLPIARPSIGADADGTPAHLPRETHAAVHAAYRAEPARTTAGRAAGRSAALHPLRPGRGPSAQLPRAPRNKRGGLNASVPGRPRGPPRPPAGCKAPAETSKKTNTRALRGRGDCVPRVAPERRPWAAPPARVARHPGSTIIFLPRVPPPPSQLPASMSEPRQHTVQQSLAKHSANSCEAPMTHSGMPPSVRKRHTDGECPWDEQPFATFISFGSIGTRSSRPKP